MSKGRFKDFDWAMPGDNSGNAVYPNDTIKVSLLLDIRDQLKELIALTHGKGAKRKPRRKAK